MELSIIVPVYNCVHYLERTTQLLITQEINEYEVLLIDDGSNDGSAELCDILSEKYHNVKAYHTENLGPGHARNEGISNAQGRYIAFCDSDDRPTKNMYGMLLKTLLNKKIDYIICDIYSERDKKCLGFPWENDIMLEQPKIMSELFARMLGNLKDDSNEIPIWGSSVRGIYNRDILIKNDIKFPEDIRFAEDLVFNIRYLKKIQSCYVLNRPLYFYSCNGDSLMNSHVRYNNRVFNDRLRLSEYIIFEINQIDESMELFKRFATSQRCYFIESIGNEARGIKDHGYLQAYKDIKKITNHPLVKSAFKNYDARDLKKRISYSWVKKRYSLLLLLYFAIRLR